MLAGGRNGQVDEAIQVIHTGYNNYDSSKRHTGSQMERSRWRDLNVRWANTMPNLAHCNGVQHNLSRLYTSVTANYVQVQVNENRLTPSGHEEAITEKAG